MMAPIVAAVRPPKNKPTSCASSALLLINESIKAAELNPDPQAGLKIYPIWLLALVVIPEYLHYS